jgi:hypothetical protein
MIIDERHKSILPARLWGDGNPEGVRQRCAQEVANTAHAAKLMGVSVVNGFTGSPVWHMLYFFPPTSDAMIDAGYKEFADRWNPILDALTTKMCAMRMTHPQKSPTTSTQQNGRWKP